VGAERALGRAGGPDGGLVGQRQARDRVQAAGVRGGRDPGVRQQLAVEGGAAEQVGDLAPVDGVVGLELALPGQRLDGRVEDQASSPAGV
jgi:hypothetical protein